MVYIQHMPEKKWSHGFYHDVCMVAFAFVNESTSIPDLYIEDAANKKCDDFSLNDMNKIAFCYV